MPALHRNDERVMLVRFMLENDSEGKAIYTSSSFFIECVTSKKMKRFLNINITRLNLFSYVCILDSLIKKVYNQVIVMYRKISSYTILCNSDCYGDLFTLFPDNNGVSHDPEIQLKLFWIF